MSDLDQVGGYELLCRLSARHGWSLGLFVDRDLSTKRPLLRTTDAPAQLSALQVVYRHGRDDADGEAVPAKYVRRALGPGDEQLERAAWDVLNSLRLLGVIKVGLL